MQTTKNGKGQIALEITGHISIQNQKEIPMVFYSQDPTEDVSFKVHQTLSHVTSSFEESYIDSGARLEVTLTADAEYTIANVIVIMGGADITDDVYAAGTVTISEVTGDVEIIATATQGA